MPPKAKKAKADELIGRIGETVLSNPVSHRDRQVNEASLLTLRKAEENDAPAIVAWIMSEEELKWLGGDRSRSTLDNVKEWIGARFGSFVLEHRKRPVAFINADVLFDGDVATPHIEIGRLVVAPGERRKGFGSATVLHLNREIDQALESLKLFNRQTYMRRVRQNWVALELLRRLPFKITKDPREQNDKLNEWYLYRERRNHRLLADMISARRKLKGLSREALAFYGGVSLSSIVAYENDKKKPGHATMRDLASVLNDSQAGYFETLMAYFGEALPDNVTSFTTLDEDKNNFLMDLWVVSDEFGEMLNEDFFDNSVKAVRNGYCRYYFFPETQDPANFRFLRERFRQNIIDEEKRKLIRFFKAPAALCQLRMAVHKPNDFGADSITIAGENLSRIPLPTAITQNIVKTLRSTMSRTEVSID